MIFHDLVLFAGHARIMYDVEIEIFEFARERTMLWNIKSEPMSARCGLRLSAQGRRDTMPPAL